MRYDLYDVLYYDKYISTELNKQVLTLYPTPYKIFDLDSQEYLLVEDVFSDIIAELELMNSGHADIITVDENKQADYIYILNSYIKEFENIEITINSSSADINVYGRTYETEEIEDINGVNIKRNFVWVEGAENISGCIKQLTGYKNIFSYFYKDEDEKIKIKTLEKYREGMSKPYYTQDDKYTYTWLDHFSGGSGTQLDPYLISNRTDYENIENDLSAFYLQTNNIDFGGIDNPINPLTGVYTKNFLGNYDGGNFKLLNMYVNIGNINPTQSVLTRLFPNLGNGSTIKNVIFEKADMFSSNNGGATLRVISSVDRTNIINVHLINSKFIIEDKTYTGNFIETSFLGQITLTGKTTISRVSIQNCEFFSPITQTQHRAAALCVFVNTGSASIHEITETFVNNCNIRGANAGSFYSVINGGSTSNRATMFHNNCYAKKCTINGSLSILQTGGFSGRFLNLGTVFKLLNFYIADSEIVTNGPPDVGTVSSSIYTNNITHINAYYDTAITTANNNFFSVTTYKPKTTAEMKNQATYAEFDFVNVWEILPGNEYPTLINNIERPDIPPDPVNIVGYLKLNEYYIPYYAIAEFGYTPSVAFKNENGNIFGLLVAETSPVYIGTFPIKIL
jgi:hypothetical protein